MTQFFIGAPYYFKEGDSTYITTYLSADREMGYDNQTSALSYMSSAHGLVTFPTSASLIDTYVTIGTEQTITANKTITGNLYLADVSATSISATTGNFDNVDAHMTSAGVHFTEASIDHTNITNKGTNTHAQIDSHITSASVHFTLDSFSYGDVSGAGSSTDNAIARFDGTTGKLLQNSNVTIDDNGNINVGTLTINDPGGALQQAFKFTNDDGIIIQAQESYKSEIILMDRDADSTGNIFFTVQSVSGSSPNIEEMSIGHEVTYGSEFVIKTNIGASATKRNINIYTEDNRNQLLLTSAGDVMVGQGLNVSGTLGIGDTGHEGSGITINQLANDDIILSLKSSDVSHGVTTLLETDTYLGIKKNHSTGGSNIICITDDNYAPVMTISAVSPDEPIGGAVNINASIINGTGTNPVVNGALFGVSNNGTLKFNIEPDGDLETWTTGTETSLVMYTASGTGKYKWDGATNTFSFGSGSVGVDYSIAIIGQSNSFSATWMEDEDYFNIHDDVLMDSNLTVSGNTYLTNVSATNINATGNITAGVGPHAFGGAAIASQQLRILGNFASDGSDNSVIGIYHGTSMTGASDDAFLYGTYLGTRITTQDASDTIQQIAQLYLVEPVITKGASDTINTASTLWVTSAPTEATNNYAILVDAGDTKLQTLTTVGNTYLANVSATSVSTGTLSADNGYTGSFDLTASSTVTVVGGVITGVA